MRLKAVRQMNKLTQSEVAEKLGMRASTISQYEQNKRSPSVETLKKLAKLFNCKVDDLL